MESQEKTIDLAQGSIHYRELGSGAPIVFVHGVLVNGSLWRAVAPALARDHRCIVPDWPLGAHTTPMHPGADLSVPGQARLVADFLEALDLRDVTLVGNDSGGAIAQLVAAYHPERLGRLVLTPSDAYEVFPPAMFSYLSWVPRVPGLSALLMKSMLHIPWLRTLPIAFGWLSEKDLPTEVLEGWVRPAATKSGVRRDLGKFLRSVSPAHTIEAARRLAGFDKPALLLWSENGFFPVALARRLEQELPNGRLVLVERAGIFVAEDQPEHVAEVIDSFLREGARPRLAS